MDSSSTLSWHERGRLFHQRLKEEVALGRIAWADGTAWITWGSQVTCLRRSHPCESIRRAFWRCRTARIIVWSVLRCSGLLRGGRSVSHLCFWGWLRRPGEAATSCGSRSD